MKPALLAMDHERSGGACQVKIDISVLYREVMKLHAVNCIYILYSDPLVCCFVLFCFLYKYMIGILECHMHWVVMVVMDED